MPRGVGLWIAVQKNEWRSLATVPQANRTSCQGKVQQFKIFKKVHFCPVRRSQSSTEFTRCVLDICIENCCQSLGRMPSMTGQTL